MFTNKKKMHFIGIGGIGMSGIAQILLAQGLRVSGSDLKSSTLIEKLRGLGAEVFIGHSSSNLKDADVVIYSSAISKNNPELAAARSQGRQVLSRAQALAALANEKKTIAVTGAHGKTTTASLISHMLLMCGLKPTICVGGELFSLNGNAFLGKGNYFVLEADESDGSFLNLSPHYSVITNIDKEHLDYYGNLERIKEAFAVFMDNTKDEGRILFCLDDLELTKIASSLNKKSLSYGLSSQAQVFAKDMNFQGDTTSFNCVYKRQNLGKIILKILGRHNICNALAAVGLGLELGLDFKSIQQALGSYEGVKRRLELKFKEKNILIFEDYAHHPREITVSLEALKSFKYKRMVVVFQPHRYTRTKFLINDFGKCFQGADCLIITDIYPASETPIEGISAGNICQRAREAKIKDVRFLPKNRILKQLLKEIRYGDLVVIMGAGDIGSISNALAERIKDKYPL